MAGSTSAAVLDFEGSKLDPFMAGQIIDEEYAPVVSISAINLSDGPDVAVIFDSTDLNPAGGDYDLVGPFLSNNSSLEKIDPGNILIIQERNDCDFRAGFCETPDDEGGRPGGQIEFLFSMDVILESVDFFDIELIENDGNPDSEIHLYDSAGDEIMAGMFFVPSTGGDNLWNQLDFNAVSGVRKLVIELNGSGAIDNLSFTVVPIPAAAWMFGSALCLLGWMRLRATS